MASTFYTRISILLTLPFSIRKKVLSYFFNRVTFTKSSNSEIIWTSFYYFALTQPIRIEERLDHYLIGFRYASRNLNLFVRKGDSSDIYVFFQVFIRDEYLPLFSQLKMREESFNSCLDAGANIGYFAIAMLCWFPDCKVFCVEPDQENYSVLLKNIDFNGLVNVVPIHAALWVRCTRLFLKKNSVQEWAYAVTEDVTTDGECEALTLKAISQKYSEEGFYTIKLDVEGAEQQLFEDSEFLQGLRLTRIIGLEIHDDKANRQMIQGTLRTLGYSISNQGELTLAERTE